MGLEHPCQALVLERIDRIQRLSGRRRGELDQLRGAVEPKQRVREVVTGTCEMSGKRICLELSPR